VLDLDRESPSIGTEHTDLTANGPLRDVVVVGHDESSPTESGSEHAAGESLGEASAFTCVDDALESGLGDPEGLERHEQDR